MLNIIFGDVPGAVYHPPVYFDNQYQDEWITDPLSKQMIKDVDGSILLHPAYDFLRTPFVYVDDLVSMPVIAEKDGKMGLVLPDGRDTVVLPFDYDDISLRDEEPWFELTKDGQTKLWNGLDELAD